MNDKLEELKNLIASLEEDSPLRDQLEAALKTEEERLAEESSKAEGTPEDTAPKTEDAQAEATDTRTDDSNTILGALDNVINKIDDLMQDDEFVSGVAGFVLGAAVVGLGVVGLDAIKRG